MKTAIQNRINRYKALSNAIKNVPNVINKVVNDNKDVLLSLNRDQMLLGRDNKGNVLSPSYLSDPYFSSPAKAQAYARMKYALESMHNSLLWYPVQLFPDKDRNTPNLIVSGKFQDAMFISTSGDSFTIGSSYIDSSNINAKYKNNVFGIAPESAAYFYREYIRPVIINSLNVK